MNRIPFPLLLLSMAPLWLAAADINVDPRAGDDSGDGSAQAPLKTLEAALSRASAGDVILLQAGAYPDFQYMGGEDRKTPLIEGGCVTVKPAIGVDKPKETVSLGRLTFGGRAGVYKGEDRKGVFDINLRIEKFAVSFGPGDELLVEGCDITNTGGGIVLNSVNSIASGNMAEKELASTGENNLPRTMYQEFVYTVETTPAGVKITVDAGADGTVDLEALDENSDYTAGRVGLFNHAKNGSHRTDVTKVDAKLR